MNAGLPMNQWNAGLRSHLLQIQLKARIILTPTLIFLIGINSAFTQEQRSLKSYGKETGDSILQDGCWLKADRKRQNEEWRKANLYNLAVENGNNRYKTISQIRDFYSWFDLEREKQGHEIYWIGIAAIAAGQLAKLDNGFVRFFIVRNKEIVKFANEGSNKVFEFAYPLLEKVYFSNEIIKGKDAENWDLEYGRMEQCTILDPLYKELSPRALGRLDRMASGKGLFKLGVPKELRYTGSIEDCQARFEHGINIMIPYYLAHVVNKNHH